MIRYEPPSPADGPALAAMARDSFVATFGSLYAPEDLQAFLDQAFGPDGLPADIARPEIELRIARADDGAIVGFAKLGPVSLPWDEPTAVELRQLYILPAWHGRGVAAGLMDWALAHARERQASAMVLSVYVDNHRAQAFYRRYGFGEVGRYAFPVGNHIDDDRIWRLPLRGETIK